MTTPLSPSRPRAADCGNSGGWQANSWWGIPATWVARTNLKRFLKPWRSSNQKQASFFYLLVEAIRKPTLKEKRSNANSPKSCSRYQDRETLPDSLGVADVHL